MAGEDDHYEVAIAVYGCPCRVTITASTGDVASVTVGNTDDDGEHGDDENKD